MIGVSWIRRDSALPVAAVIARTVVALPDRALHFALHFHRFRVTLHFEAIRHCRLLSHYKADNEHVGGCRVASFEISVALLKVRLLVLFHL